MGREDGGLRGGGEDLEADGRSGGGNEPELIAFAGRRGREAAGPDDDAGSLVVEDAGAESGIAGLRGEGDVDGAGSADHALEIGAGSGHLLRTRLGEGELSAEIAVLAGVPEVGGPEPSAEAGEDNGGGGESRSEPCPASDGRDQRGGRLELRPAAGFGFRLDAGHESFFDAGRGNGRGRGHTGQNGARARSRQEAGTLRADLYMSLEGLPFLTIQRPEGVEVRVFRIDVSFHFQKSVSGTAWRCGPEF